MTSTKSLAVALLAASCSSGAAAFAPLSKPSSQGTVRVVSSSSTTALALGIPKFLLPKEEQEQSDEKTKSSSSTNKMEEKKVGLSGLFQLITAGAGAPFLGDFQGVDEETGKFMFSLEANNLVDEDGNSKQTSMPYFENGWVDEDDTGFQWPWQKKKD